MKYINKFSTNADYQAFTEGGGYVTPNVCFITETMGLVVKPKINNGGSEEPSVVNINVGDVAYYTNGEIKTISKDKWNSSLGTPIGVVVIPSNFLPDGKARIVSLKAVNSSGNASTSHEYMYWEQSGNYVDTTLTNYTKVPITNNTGSVSSSSNSYGYLPSDNFTGDTSFVDSNAKYYGTDANKIPSPYNGSEFNTDYSKDISGYNNALSDFNGLSNTQVLVGLGNDYVAANAAYNYSDGVSNTQWYLPSAGELGFMVARLKSINSTISQLGFVAVPSSYFWSSTEYSSSYAYYVFTNLGGVYYSSKDDYNYVRSGVAAILAEKDDYLDVFVEDFKYSEQPILCTISENLADIYQALRNLLEVFRSNYEDAMQVALFDTVEDFKLYWGQTLLNALKALHDVRFSVKE